MKHGVAAFLLVFAGFFAVAAPATAQGFGQLVSPILTLDREKLFAGTLYGQRVNRELEAESNAMASETRSIEAALEAEEKDLTEKRATMDPEAFRALASSFDDKVQGLRDERSAAEEDLRTRIDTAKSAFFNHIGPALGQLVRDRGAALIIDRRAVLLAAADVDITDEAIQRVDAVLGDGSDLGVDEPSTDKAVVPDEPAASDGTVGVDTIPAPELPTQEPDAAPAE